MKSTLFAVIGVLALLVWTVNACAPKAVPAPAPSPSPTSPPAIARGPAPTVSPGGWAQVLADASKEGKLTPYLFLFVGKFGSAVARSMEQTYGIRMSPVTGTGTMLIERIRSERAAGKYIADTFDSAASLVATAKMDGLTANIGPLPELENKDIWEPTPA